MYLCKDNTIAGIHLRHASYINFWVKCLSCLRIFTFFFGIGLDLEKPFEMPLKRWWFDFFFRLPRCCPTHAEKAVRWVSVFFWHLHKLGWFCFILIAMWMNWRRLGERTHSSSLAPAACVCLAVPAGSLEIVLKTVLCLLFIFAHQYANWSLLIM